MKAAQRSATFAAKESQMEWDRGMRTKKNTYRGVTGLLSLRVGGAAPVLTVRCLSEKKKPRKLCDYAGGDKQDLRCSDETSTIDKAASPPLSYSGGVWAMKYVSEIGMPGLLAVRTGISMVAMAE